MTTIIRNAGQGKQKRDHRRNLLLRFGLSLLIIILLNLVSGFIFNRVDLTAEKRYSISPATKKILKDLDDVVYFKVYLEGDFPAGFKKLRNETREMLDEFRAYTDNIQYEFIDPSKADNIKDKNEFYRQLVAKGLEATQLQVNSDDGLSQKIIFPGALARYRGKEIPIQLLISQMNTPPELVLNNSVQNLEYILAISIQQLTLVSKPKIAFIYGHGELKEIEVADISKSLSAFYDVERVQINDTLSRLFSVEPGDSFINKYEAVIIAKPTSPFSDKDKYIIDQFIMHGGKILWLIDPVFASMDSLQTSWETVGVVQDLNIEDQLFHYGARLNSNLALDLSACPIPKPMGQIGGQPQYKLFPWYFFPVIFPQSNHPITNNLNAIKCEFVSTVDTVSAPNIRKTVLLRTSKYTQVAKAPVLISLKMLGQKPEEKNFSLPPQAVACLLEGRFTSSFANRLPPEMKENKEIGFMAEGKPSKMIVVGDGDLIRNHLDEQTGQIYRLGYDGYLGQTFGNKDLIMNMMNYLCEQTGLIDVRSKALTLRLLDGTRLKKDKTGIKLVNVALPVMMVLAYGFYRSWRQRRKYAGKLNS